MINKLLQIACVACVLASCGNQEVKNKTNTKAVADSANFTTIQWQDSIKNIGTVENGKAVNLKYVCINTGNKPLIIANAKPSCGCTIANYTQHPIAPKDSGEVTAIFNGKMDGDVHKSIVVTTNTKNNTEHILYFNGTVVGGKSNDKVMTPHNKPVPVSK